MTTTRRIPSWAILNTALLFAPQALGFGVFFMWFLPNPAIKLPALFTVAFYYFVVIRICRQTSGFRGSLWVEYKKQRLPTWKDKSLLVLGLAGFSLLAYGGLYFTCPAWVTSAIGADAKKEVTVVAFYDPHSKHCDYRLVLEEMSPIMGKGFCVASGEVTENLTKGSKVTLYGQESVLGFRFTKIES